MKLNQLIRFRVTQYDADRRVLSHTGEIQEGTVLRSEGDGWMVQVTGSELPYYVTEADILQED